MENINVSFISWHNFDHILEIYQICKLKSFSFHNEMASKKIDRKISYNFFTVWLYKKKYVSHIAFIYFCFYIFFLSFFMKHTMSNNLGWNGNSWQLHRINGNDAVYIRFDNTNEYIGCFIRHLHMECDCFLCDYCAPLWGVGRCLLLLLMPSSMLSPYVPHVHVNALATL